MNDDYLKRAKEAFEDEEKRRRYAEGIEQMRLNVLAWRKENPGKEIQILFNYPPEVFVAATITDALAAGIIKPNAAALEMILEVCDPDWASVFMLRTAVESEERGKLVIGKSVKGDVLTCAWCGSPNNVLSSFGGETPQQPGEGDLLVCINCGDFNVYTEGKMVKAVEDYLRQLEPYQRLIVTKARDEIKKRGPIL